MTSSVEDTFDSTFLRSSLLSTFQSVPVDPLYGFGRRAHFVTSLNEPAKTPPTFQFAGNKLPFSSSCDLSIRRNHANLREMLSS